MSAMTRIVPPHKGHKVTSMLKTRSFFSHSVSFIIPFVLRSLNRPDPLFWDNEFSNLRIGSEYTVIPNKIMSGSGYQRGKFA